MCTIGTNTCTTNSNNRQCTSGQICRNNQCQQGIYNDEIMHLVKLFSVECLCFFILIKSNKEYIYYIQHHALMIMTVYQVKCVQVDCVNQDHALGMDSVPMVQIAIVTYVNVKVNILLILFR